MSSTLTSYLETIARYPLLDKNQEIILGRRVQRWLNDPNPSPSVIRSGRRAQDKMIQCNLRLVVSVCKKYVRHRNHKSDLLDLIQEGTLGLTRGVQKFDPERGYALSTYVYWWIRQAINRYRQYHERLIRLPGGGTDAIAKTRVFIYKFVAEHGRRPTVEECAAHCRITPSRMKAYLRQQDDCSSLDIRTNRGEGNALVEVIQDEDDEDMLDRIAFDLGAQFLCDQLSQLSESERFVVEHHYGIGKDTPLSIAAVSRLKGVSRERTRQIHERALVKLRINAAVPA